MFTLWIVYCSHVNTFRVHLDISSDIILIWSFSLICTEPHTWKYSKINNMVNESKNGVQTHNFHFVFSHHKWQEPALYLVLSVIFFRSQHVVPRWFQYICNKWNRLVWNHDLNRPKHCAQQVRRFRSLFKVKTDFLINYCSKTDLYSFVNLIRHITQQTCTTWFRTWVNLRDWRQLIKCTADLMN